MRSRAAFAWSLGLVLLPVPPAAASPAPECSRFGVVIEEVGAASALAAAGLAAGDLLHAWERPAASSAHEAARGEIRTVFDWRWLSIEQAPRGTLRLRGERSGKARSFEVSRGAWDARMRPWLPEDLLALHREGRQRVAAGAVEAGVAAWERLAQSPRALADPHLEVWALHEVSETWASVGRGDRARAALQKAKEAAADAPTQIALWEAIAGSHEMASEMAFAEESLRSALAAAEAAVEGRPRADGQQRASRPGESLQVARALSLLGHVLRLRNRLLEATEALERALAIQQRWAPDGLEVAETLFEFGGVAWARRDAEATAAHAGRALALQERWAPGGVAVAKSLNSLAIAAGSVGRFEEAKTYLERALAIHERRAPGSMAMANCLSNLGLVARNRGDTDLALEYFRRSLALSEKIAPESRAVAVVLSNLAEVAKERGELDQAEALYRRAAALWARAAPEGTGLAGCYDELGQVALARGNLGEARSLHAKALAIRERLAPGSLEHGAGLRRLGVITERRGDLDRALALHQRALAIAERVAPGSLDEALALHNLGRLARRAGRLDEAAGLLARAVEALELQVEQAASSPDRQADYRAGHDYIYRDAIEVEVERGRSAEAFHLLERSRARSFLALLSERDLTFAGELPSPIERARKEIGARYDRALAALARWTEADGEGARAAVHRELAGLRRERERIALEVRRASPRLAALRQPAPLDLAGARQVLDPGTLALAYSVGEERTTLFALTRDGGLRVEVLPLGAAELRQQVERFLAAVRLPTPSSTAQAESRPSPAELGRSLYRSLLAPVEPLVATSERVLILADGPLHRLPFGALIREPEPAGVGRGQFLAEWKPLHTALSVTVFGTLRAAAEASRSAAAVGDVPLVAFADPRYPRQPAPGSGPPSPLLRILGPGLRRFDWAALPHTRREVERIAEVYPGARVFLGAQATEERAKSVARDVRVLHFATHGYTDDRTPLDSALVLTIPDELPADRDNGLLQVWEIFESVRLDADLVVLSACESALGRELSGEGLIGLTRAFQHAGARSVVASLWSVADQVTAELMARFHRHRAAGLSTDQALRAAQVELIRQPIRIVTASGQAIDTDASSPFFWAAFQLFGDWR